MTQSKKCYWNITTSFFVNSRTFAAHFNQIAVRDIFLSDISMPNIPTFYVILNCISLSVMIITTFMCLTILAVLLLRKNVFNNIQMVLIFNNYLTSLIRGIFGIMHLTDVLKGDFKLSSTIDQETFWCRLRTNIESSFILSGYLACVLQVCLILNFQNTTDADLLMSRLDSVCVESHTRIIHVWSSVAPTLSLFLVSGFSH